MAREADPHHVVHLALVPVGARPQVGARRHLLVLADLRLHPQVPRVVHASPARRPSRSAGPRRSDQGSQRRAASRIPACRGRSPSPRGARPAPPRRSLRRGTRVLPTACSPNISRSRSMSFGSLIIVSRSAHRLEQPFFCSASAGSPSIFFCKLHQPLEQAPRAAAGSRKCRRPPAAAGRSPAAPRSCGTSRRSTRRPPSRCTTSAPASGPRSASPPAPSCRSPCPATIITSALPRREPHHLRPEARDVEARRGRSPSTRSRSRPAPSASATASSCASS